MNRVSFIELNALRRAFPRILNGLPGDVDYDQSEPDRAQEVLQSWEALRSLLDRTTENDPAENLEECIVALNEAEELYAQIAMSGYSLDTKSGNQHLEPLRDAIDLFKRLAEF